MDDDSSQSTFQTLASVLAGGLAGYVDAQNQQPVYVTPTTPQTAYGIAGQPSGTAAAGSFTLSPVMLALLAVGAFFLLKK